MLEIRLAEHSDKKDIENLLHSNGLNLNIDSYMSSCMVAYENSKVIGCSGFIQKGNIALITFIVVDKKRRMEYIGDGLLKALMNVANNRNVNKVICNWNGDFLQNLGFNSISIDNNQKYLDLFNENINIRKPIVEATLPDFFARSCNALK